MFHQDWEQEARQKKRTIPSRRKNNCVIRNQEFAQQTVVNKISAMRSGSAGSGPITCWKQ